MLVQLFLVVQIPAFSEYFSHHEHDLDTPEVAKDERVPFIVGTILCFLAFAAYLIYQLKMNQNAAIAEVLQLRHYFRTISHGFPSSVPSHARCVVSST